MAIIEVKISGALYNGQIVPIIGGFVAEAEEAIAAQGVSEVQFVLDRRVKNPTPYYETQITTDRLQDDSLVHDRNIVYGPWLEGVSSRNQTSRFKGYHAFRIARQKLQGEAQGIADAVLKQYLGRQKP